MMSQQSLSPPAKKGRILGPEEGGGGEGVMGSEWGRLWELATVACWLAEEEKQRKTNSPVGLSSIMSVMVGEEEQRTKAGPFEDVGLSRTSSRAKDAMGLTSLGAVVDEEEGQRKKKLKATHGTTHPAVVIGDEEEKTRREGKAELFAEVGSSSKSGAPVVACWLAEEEEKQRKTKRKASPFEEDVGLSSIMSVMAGEEEQRTKAGPFEDVGSSRTSSRAKDAMGLTSLEGVVEEGQRKKKKITHPAVEEEKTRRKGKAQLFAEVGCCSNNKSAAALDGRGITPPMVVAARRRRSSRPYKKRVTGRPVLMGWMEKAVRMGGTRPQLVVKKKISNTDLDPHFARLPLPFSRPGAPSMGGVERLVAELSPAEHRAVHGDQGLAVTVLDRWGREYHGATLKKWPSKWYVLTNGKVVSRILQGNALKKDDVVEFFHFRVSPPQPQLQPPGGQEGQLVLVVSVAEAAEGV